MMMPFGHGTDAGSDLKQLCGRIRASRGEANLEDCGFGPCSSTGLVIPEGTPALLENDHSVGSEFAPRTYQIARNFRFFWHKTRDESFPQGGVVLRMAALDWLRTCHWAGTH
jgi:hypothetical protein